MALIQCPECSKEISDKAVSCPNCGLPINNLNTTNTAFKQEELICPEFPSDMSIGKQIVNWTYDAAVEGQYEQSQNAEEILPNGKMHLLLHEKGIKVCGSFFMELMQIHFSQIISFSEITEKELADKSVIGRSIVGGILLGPVGAVIGGISGVGSKKKNKYYLIMNFWDRTTRKPIAISIGCKTSSANFIKKVEKTKKNKGY